MLFQKNSFNNGEAKKELDKIKEIKDSTDREKLIYKSKKYMYDFRKFRTIRTFARDIYDGKISLEEADEDKSDLADEIENFKNKTRPKSPEKKTTKRSCCL